MKIHQNLSFLIHKYKTIYNERMNNDNNNIKNTNFYTNNKTMLYEEHLWP